jgi:SagB-type dehydrogenase family enzyme
MDLKERRPFLQAGRGTEWEDLVRDQYQGVPMPPFQKPYPMDAPLVDLVAPGDLTAETLCCGQTTLIDAINARKSHRKFTAEPLSLAELSWLLWATQGVKGYRKDGAATLRTVPSAGGRQPFELYLLVHNVDDLEPGLYRYLALDHKLCLLRTPVEPVPNRWFLRNCALTLIWCALPYRTEWRHDRFAHKMIALDAGHACENLYLAVEAIGAGTCAVAVYWQDEMDALLGVDGVDEFTMYVAPVGKIRRHREAKHYSE